MMIDLDPQGSASYYFRIRAGKKLTSKKFIKGSKQVRKNIKGTDFENLDSIPSTISFRKMDITLDGLKRSRKRLKEMLAPMKKEYDHLFLDCPPNITLVSENVFVAADLILVPIIPTTLSVLTYEKLLDFFNDKSLKVSKILGFFSMVEKRKKMHQQTLENLRKDPHILKTMIPYAADVEKMGIYREPVFEFKPRSRAAEAYEALWKEIKENL
jgi:cellulose biosynthesis protein BcsQ